MIDKHIKDHKLQEVSVPVLVKDDIMYGTGQLPKFSTESYKTSNGWWLIPTAEVPLTNLMANSILNYDELPIRLCAVTQCFRSEAGSAGRTLLECLDSINSKKLKWSHFLHQKIVQKNI